FKGLAVAEARLLRGVELDSRQTGQESPQGQKVSVPLRRQLFQRMRVLDAPASRGGAPQGGEMRAGPQGLADVLGQGAHVGAVAAGDTNSQKGRAAVDNTQSLDANPPPLALAGLALARERVERHAAALQRRVHRRTLLDLAFEALQPPQKIG